MEIQRLFALKLIPKVFRSCIQENLITSYCMKCGRDSACCSTTLVSNSMISTGNNNLLR